MHISELISNLVIVFVIKQKAIKNKYKPSISFDPQCIQVKRGIADLQMIKK